MKIENFSSGFLYRVVRVLKALESFCLKPSIFWENCIKLTFSGCPRKFSHRVMYIAPSSGHISLNINMPFKLILRRFEVVFWCLEWECCTFWKTDGYSFKSTNTTTIMGCPNYGHFFSSSSISYSKLLTWQNCLTIWETEHYSSGNVLANYVQNFLISYFVSSLACCQMDLLFKY